MTKAHLEFMVIMLNGRLAKAQRSERGATAVEWVVITAALVAIAGLVYITLRDKITGKADSINLDE